MITWPHGRHNKFKTMTIMPSLENCLLAKKSWQGISDLGVSGYIPGVIVKRNGPLSYLVKVQSGDHWSRHIDHLRGATNVTVETRPPVQNDSHWDVFADLSLDSTPRTDLEPPSNLIDSSGDTD